MNKLLKDAIADAKTVRETALANAKAVLEEAFAPKLQSMLSHKIKEEMETEEEGEEVSDEDKLAVAEMQKKAGITSDEDEDVMEIDSDEEEMDSEEEEMDSEEEIEMDSEEEMEMNSEEEDVDSDEELEEILRELDSEEEDVVEMDSEEEEMPEGMHSNKEEEEEIDLEEIIKALREEEEEEEMETEGKKKKMKMMEMEEEEEEEKEAAAQEIEEAYRVIKFLRSKINEVNLLNAKLLFVNKLFRKGELTETQKVKIIETFDRAKNVHEAKLIYATLAESVTRKSAKPAIKRKMNEGYASAPQKKTQIISESNSVYNRFKSLVEYNQHNQ